MDRESRYQKSDTPWDLGRAHPELLARLRDGDFGRPARALVPGCGRGYDALALASFGWKVTAIDAAELSEQILEPLVERGGEFVAGDPLSHRSREPYQAIFDHTYFCAVDPAQRPDWGKLIDRNLASNGRLFCLVFPVDRPLELGGPPWGITADDQQRALGNAFRMCADRPVDYPGPGRQWQERWAVFERRRQP
jgi:SAM-dependent methyltransferase